MRPATVRTPLAVVGKVTEAVGLVGAQAGAVAAVEGVPQAGRGVGGRGVGGSRQLQHDARPATTEAGASKVVVGATLVMSAVVVAVPVAPCVSVTRRATG